MTHVQDPVRPKPALTSWIRDRRKTLKLSQASLGALLGVSQVQVSIWETGKGVPNSSQLHKLMDVLGPMTASTNLKSPSGPSAGPERSTMRVPAVGSFVTVLGTRDGVGKLLSIKHFEATIEYFESVACRLTKTVPLQLIQAQAPVPQTRCYWVEKGRWRIGRVLERFDTDFRVVSRQEHSLVSEPHLYVRWARPMGDPTEVLATQANESPLFHKSRHPFVTSVLAQRSASRGLSGVLSARTELHAHQVETARRVLEDPLPRYILADEVGLGKTIEAGFVIRQFLLDTPGGEVLVLVPPFLVRQWQEELATKFHIGDFGDACRVEPYSDAAVRDSGEVDLVVIDEAHHVASYAGGTAQQRRLYAAIADLAHGAPRLLLLSATPLLHNEVTFLAMLHLIDPVGHPLDGLAGFRARVEARAAIGRVLLGFTEDAPRFLLHQPLSELRRLFPKDERLGRLLDQIDAKLDGSDEERAAAIRAVRVHLSETHRIYRRLLRTRRSEELAVTFPVRGRAGVAVEMAEDDDRLAADAWLDRWREAVLLHATGMSAEERAHFESAAADAFRVFLPRVGSSVRSLLAAARYRLLADPVTMRRADLSESEATALRHMPLGDAESEVIAELCERFAELGNDPRAERLAALVEDRDECKIVVFTSFLHAAKDVHAFLATQLGRDCVAQHTADMTPTEIEAEVARFRTEDDCRVLVCDPSGEEGRNLQFAQILVHFDLSWSANRLEQRMGRLDRYGEGSTVECIAFADSADDRTYHDQWRRLLDNDFGLFNRSVAAYQFAIDGLMPRVFRDLFLGSTGAFSAISEAVRSALATEAKAIQEQDVLDSIEAVERDGGFFEELERSDAEHALIREGFDCWAGENSGELATLQLGCTRDEKNARILEYKPVFHSKHGRATLVPADWLLRWFPEGRAVRTTFVRNTAVRPSGPRLMRLGHPFYDQVRAFSDWDDRGRAFALWRSRPELAGHDVDYAFRFDFVVEGDPDPALRVILAGVEGEEPAVRASLQRRLDGFLPPFIRTIWLDAQGDLIEDEARLGVLQAPYDKHAGDLNLRGHRFEAAERELGLSDWSEVCRRARLRGEELLRSSARFVSVIAERSKTSRRSLDARVEVIRARAERSGASVSDRADAEREAALAAALLEGIQAPVLRLESVGFICVAPSPLRVSEQNDG